MPEPTKKHPTDEMIDLRLRVHRRNAERIKRYAEALEDEERTFTVAEAFPDLLAQEQQVALRAYRHRENLTQKQLAERTGIPSITSARWRTASAPSAGNGPKSWRRR